MSFAADLVLSRRTAPAFAALGAFWGAFAAQVPAIKQAVGTSDAAFGLALLIGAAGALAAMWSAPLLDRVAGRAALSFGVVALVLAWQIPGQVRDFAGFAAAMLLAAAASGFLDVVINARVAEVEAAKARPLMNLNHGLFSVSYGVFALAAGWGREAGLTPSEIFGLVGVACIGFLALIGRGPEAPSPSDEASPAAVSLPWALIVPAGVILLIAFMAEQGTEGWSALRLERGLGASPAGGAAGPALLGLTMAAGRLAGQWLLQRMNEVRLITLAAALSAAGSGLAAVAWSVPVAYLGFAVLGLGVSVVAPSAFALVARMVDAQRRTAAISRLSLIGYMGFFIGPPLMGGLSELFGLGASFGMLAGLLAAIPLVWIPIYLRAAARRAAPA